MRCRTVDCRLSITCRFRFEDFPENWWEYICPVHALELQGYAEIEKIDASNPIRKYPADFGRGFNQKLEGVSTSRYILDRCETIRNRWRKKQLTFAEASESLAATLNAVGVIGIDQKDPISWLKS